MLVGTVAIDFVFKDNVGVFARLNLLNKVSGSIGAGVVRGESYSIVSENVVFGASVRAVKLRPPEPKPLLVSMLRSQLTAARCSPVRFAAVLAGTRGFAEDVFLATALAGP